jgi:hypothetical protein
LVAVQRVFGDRVVEPFADGAVSAERRPGNALDGRAGVRGEFVLVAELVGEAEE